MGCCIEVKKYVYLINTKHVKMKINSHGWKYEKKNNLPPLGPIDSRSSPVFPALSLTIANLSSCSSKPHYSYC